MISTADVKDFLKIPYDDEDILISNILQAGYDYLDGAIDDFDEIYTENEAFQRKADMFILHFWCPDAYDQREGGYDGNRMTMNYPARAMLTQLQLYKKGGE